MSSLHREGRTHQIPSHPAFALVAWRSADDIAVTVVDHFECFEEVVVTEKLDGENTTLKNLRGRNLPEITTHNALLSDHFFFLLLALL